jgi:hypothetical protein
MAESSRFWTTNATGDGPVGGYTQQQFYDFMRKVFITDQEATRGVVFGEQGALACTGTASPIAVAAGSAIVYGFFYESTASVNLTVTTPAVGTTGGRVILRAGWSAQTVRLVAVRNTDGQIAIPTLTQSAGSTWEISLATFTITTGGVIALTDDRKYLEIGSKVIPDGVETLSIKDANVTLAKMASGSVDSSQVVAGAIDLAHMSADSVDSNQYVDGSIDLIHMSANSVDATKIVDRTRTFLVQPTRGIGTTDMLIGWNMPDGVDAAVMGNFFMPSDYVSGLTVKAVLLGVNSGNVYAQNFIAAGAEGENYSNHNNDVHSAVAIVANQIAVIHSVTAGGASDYITLQYTRYGTSGSDTVNASVYFMGWLVTYTADS